MKVRKMGFSAKIFILIIVLFLASDSIVGVVVYNKTKDALVMQIKDSAKNMAASVAGSLDGALFRGMKAGDENSDNYKKALSTLSIFYEKAGVEYVYTLGKKEDGTSQFLVDSDTEEPAMPGDAYEVDAEEVSKAYNGETVITEDVTEDEWGSHLTAYSPIYDGNEITALVGVDVSASSVDAKVNEMKKIIIVMCVVILICSILISLFISIMLKGGFRKLNDKVKDLATGDGDLTKKIEINSGDEFEVIADNINMFIDNIRNIMNKISNVSDELRDSSVNIAKHLDEAGEATSEVSMNITDVSSTMQETTATMNEIKDLIDKIRNEVLLMSEKVSGGNEYAKEISASAIANKKSAFADREETKKRVDEMASIVNSKINDSKSVDQINMLTENIINITTETNLLSLNASIEAARAGEAGKGFAVVASEIGKLANNSAESAVRIQEVSSAVISAVNALAEEAEKMIEFINETTIGEYEKLINTGDEFNNAANAFSEIMGDIYEIDENIQDEINGINDSINTINVAVEDTTGNLIEVAQRTGSVSSSIKDIDDEANISSEMSGKLYEQVNKFKI